MTPEDDFTPCNIIEWEQKHGIYRRQVNGMTYIYCGNYPATCESIERENRARYARERTAIEQDRQAEERSGRDAEIQKQNRFL